MNERGGTTRECGATIMRLGAWRMKGRTSLASNEVSGVATSATIRRSTATEDMLRSDRERGEGFLE